MNKSMFSSKTSEWETPKAFFDKLNEEFHFTLDPCATSENAKCVRYFTKEQDGLAQSWQGECVFCNPPYGREIRKWVAKAFAETAIGVNTTVVMLIPARTDTAFFMISYMEMQRYALSVGDYISMKASPQHRFRQ